MSLEQKAANFDKIIDILHNYEAHAFLDHLDEHRAMRKAFYEVHEIVEDFFESVPQEETKLGRAEA